ncbi:MAG TPA: 5'-nucleotidase C-terminal domain-containing protein [Symbiobacteriaceae bacterium]|jgi:2',3'-cyclic-nucleotide 2'-phosphodiesterase (5'-nucleotidase family)
MRRFLALMLSLFLLVSVAGVAGAGADNNGVITPQAWASNATYDWYKALDVTTGRSKGEPQTLSYTFTAKANVARLTVDNDGIKELDVAVNGRRLNLNTFFNPSGKGEASFDISGLITWGVNTLDVQALGSPNASAKIAVEIPALTARILHVNDLHANIDPMPKVAAYVKAAKAQGGNVFFVDGGDNFSGSPVSDLNKGVPMIQVLNNSGLDLMVAGNHDFDHGPANTQARRDESNFRWLGANIALVDPAATPIKAFDPYKIYTNDLGQKIAFIAVTEFPPATGAKNIVGLQFTDALAPAQAQVAALKDQVNMVVLVSHNGVDYDPQLAAIPGVDLIVGAHSHTYLSTPEVASGVPIVQVGSSAAYVGDIVVRKADTRTFSGGATGGAYTVSTKGLTATDETVKSIVDQWNAQMGPQLDAKIGYTPIELNRDDRYIKDVSIGNLITDAMRAYMGTEIAVTNNGGIRTSIPAGDIAMRQIYQVLPFGNFVMKFNLTGAQIRQLIEYSYLRDNRFQVDLQTSGLTYTIYTKPTGGLDHIDFKVNGQPLDLNRVYSVAMADYIGTGGSGYPVPSFASPSDISSDVDAIIVGEYVKSVGNLSYTPSAGRIVVKSAPTPIAVSKLNFYNSSSLLAAGSGGTLVPLTNQATVLVTAEATGYQYERSATAPKNFVKVDAGKPVPLAAMQQVGSGKVVGLGAIMVANGYKASYQNPQWFTNLLDLLTGRSSGTVLVDEDHGQYYDNAKFTQVRDFLADRGYTMTFTGKTGALTADKLVGVDVLFITTPGNAVGLYTAAELAVLNTWVANGGKVILASQTDYGNNANPTEFNTIAAAIGTVIRFNSDEVRDDVSKDGTANYSPVTDEFNAAYPQLLKVR